MPRAAESKILPFEKVAALCRELRDEGLRLVTTNGCFDLLHLGHLEYLAEARRRGDKLLVGVNSDASVRKLKGPSRPLFEETVRARQLAALECVDYVTIFPHDTPVELIREARPAVHVKGGDYEGKNLPEKRILDEIGAELLLLPFVPGYSTTSLLQRLTEL